MHLSSKQTDALKPKIDCSALALDAHFRQNKQLQISNCTRDASSNTKGRAGPVRRPERSETLCQSLVMAKTKVRAEGRSKLKTGFTFGGVLQIRVVMELQSDGALRISQSGIRSHCRPARLMRSGAETSCETG